MVQDPKKLTRAHKIALGIISLACCCLIGISAFALAAPDAASELADQQAEQAAEQAQQQNTGSSDESAPADGNEAGEGSNEGGSSSQDNANSGGSSSNSGPSNGNGSAGGNSSSQGGNSSSSSGQSGSSSSGGGSSSSQGSTDSGTVTVSVSVSSSAADGRVSGSATPTFEKGATAYDALCATGLSVTSKNSQYGIYVSAIGGLAEFEYGGSSGWMYSVNGSAPNISCGKYVLKDGDRVSWYYVV